MKTVIGVKFRKPGKVYFFDPENMQIKKEKLYSEKVEITYELSKDIKIEER